MKKALAILLFTIVPIISLANIAYALDLGMGYVNDIGLAQAVQNDPRAMAVDIIKYLMTFLGIIAVIVILYGGFIWLTAGGNEQRVEKAKKTLIAGVIGLIVILAAYAIISFVISFANNIMSGSL